MAASKATSKTVVLTSYGGYKNLRVEQRPIPTVSPGHAIVRIMASGVNFAELMCTQGTYPKTPKVPAVLGLEGSGIVHEVGSGVTNVKKGDRVVVIKEFGLWTEYAEVEAEDCFPIPASMSLEHAGALFVNYVTAYIMLFDMGNLRPNKSVLIHMAAGGVGVAATQLCTTVPNVTVFGTASASKHETIKKFGVTHPIDYRTKDYVEEIRNISPKGVDIVLDPLNGADAVKGYALLKPLGKIIHYGAANVVSGSKKSLFSMARTWMSVESHNPLFMMSDNKGAFGFHLSCLHGEREALGPVIKELFDLYEKGLIKPVIDSVWNFEEVGSGMARIQERQNIGKVLITPDKQLLQAEK